MKSQIIQVVVFIALLAAIFFGVHATIESRVVDQTSMLPTLHPGDRLVVVKAAYWFSDPARGDVVIISADWQPEVGALVKRVIGLPGDTIEIKNGAVYINGSLLTEPYYNGTTTASPGGYDHVVLQQGQYFVMGDNRPGSEDSRVLGPVPRQDIIGRVCFRYWPFSTWHFFHGYSYSTS
jgi:signal peptidase I